MSAALIEKLRRARESVVSAGGRTFTIRRPTDREVTEAKDASSLRFVERFVVDWELAELDIIPGGGPERIAFDRDLWIEWVGDHPELWEALATAIVDSYRSHVASRGVSEKNF